MDIAPDEERRVVLAELGERLSGLRLREPAALEALRRSIARHGQLTPIVVFPDGARLEILDGFKRAHVARVLGWQDLRARTSAVDRADAKVQIRALHEQRGLTEIEEAWLVRSLHRDDGLPQAEIARRLDRHKSWVCRRLLLVEALEVEVQADVRLGLLSPRAAVALGALPRGNQRAASAVVIHRGLTVRQTELFVAEILGQPDEAARATRIAQWLETGPAVVSGGPTRAPRSEADGMAADIATLVRVAGRLHARLVGTPLGALGVPAVEVVLEGLCALGPVLSALGSTIGKVTGKEASA